jgi:GNAT superfamily N-acetyltransferase
VVAAFAGDPAWRFLTAGEYERLAPLFAGALFDQRVGNDSVWLVEDGAAVAMWDAPGHPSAALHDAAWAAWHREAGAVAQARMTSYEQALEQVPAPPEYWYLGVLATRPGDTGRGLATAALAPGLERADEDGLPTCLETSTTANRDFYVRRGFREWTPVDLPGGPATWWHTRRPT